MLVLAVLFCAQVSAQKIDFADVSKDTVLKHVYDVPKKNKDREAKIKEFFSEAGCGGQLTEQRIRRSKVPNVICRLAGETERTIIVGAHFDQISPAEGIIDNWTGASLLPDLYESLANEKRQHTFLFVAFTEEEAGLWGSEFYAEHMSKADVAKTDAMVNIDSLGLSATKVWGHRADPQLLRDLTAVAQAMQLPLAQVDVENVGTADSESFAPLNIPRITLHSITQETFPILHTGRDKSNALRPDDYYGSYRLISGYLAYLDQKLPRPKSPTK